MNSVKSIDILPELDSIQRDIGTFLGNKPGPNLIFFGGIHGNEHSGIIALKKEFSSEDNVLDLEGTIELLRQHDLLVDQGELVYPEEELLR